MTEYLTRTDDFMRSLGCEAYRVGGSVRDQILGRRVKDADYMVRGVALEMLFILLRDAVRNYPNPSVKPLMDRERRPLGWRVSGKGLGAIEITLPRVEVSTGPGHRDFEIVLDPMLGLSEDARRRDFTFNALYFGVFDSPGGGVVIDPTARGLYDLQHKLVHTTYPTSFRDDPLRTLRALRFVSTLGYDLSTDTEEQMFAHADSVNGLTSEGGTSGTVYEEFCKLLMGPDGAKALRLAARTGVLAHVMPELAPMIGFGQRSRYHDLTTSEHVFKALETAAHVEAPLRVRWALLFHDSGKPDAAWVDGRGLQHYYAKGDKLDHEVYSERRWREACKRLNVPRDVRESVATLVREHMVTVEGKVKGTKVRRMRVRLGDDLLRDLFMHRMCDLSGKGVKVAQNHIAQVAKMEELRQQAVRDGIPCTTKDLKIGGKDLIAAGIKGREIGRVLNAVLDEVVCEPKDTTMAPEWQMQRALAAAGEGA